ncbi:MAG: ATP-binding protein [Candidatus Sumerlaeota bacterium]
MPGHQLQADAGSILLFDPDSEELKMLAARGLPPGVMQRGYISRKGSIAEQVIESGKVRVINDTQPIKNNEAEKAAAIRSAICSPLIAKGEVLGTLNLNRYRTETGPFDEADVEVVDILATQAAISLHNARQNEQIVRQERMAAIGQTVAGISHCVKNMLSGLRGGMSLLDLAQRAQNWEAASKGAGVLRNNIERISLLVLDMLDYSKEEKKPMRANCDVVKIFNEVEEIAAYRAKRKSAELRIDCAPGAETVNLDSDQIFRCVLNLVENAIDALYDEDGIVTMRCEKAREAILAEAFGALPDTEVYDIIVEDNGSGIPEENLATIFQPFFSTKDSKGTGLGLAVTKKITEEHGGKVLIRTEAGRGTAFHLLIPQP